MPTIELDGTSLYYEDTGPGSTGETIAFSHGLLWTTAQFASQIAALRARYRCIAWDHRGQGRSAADHRECISIELVWQDAVRLIQKVIGGPVHFCGLSMGGFVAMRMAARRPELVRSLILLETSADPEAIENIARYRLLTRVLKLLGPKIIKNRVAPIMLGKTLIADKARRKDLAAFVDLMSQRRDIWRAVNGVVDRAGIHDELGRITAPTLVVVGDEDVATPRPKAERIVAGIAGAKLVTIPRAGHSSPVEEPELVTAAIEAFLQALPAQR
jgi:pimeloyl-ACP methyl ester carboxylesterase